MPTTASSSRQAVPASAARQRLRGVRRRRRAKSRRRLSQRRGSGALQQRLKSQRRRRGELDRGRRRPSRSHGQPDHGRRRPRRSQCSALRGQLARNAIRDPATWARSMYVSRPSAISRCRVETQFLGLSSSMRLKGQEGATVRTSCRYSSGSRPCSGHEAMSEEMAQAHMACSSLPCFSQLALPFTMRRKALSLALL